MYKNYLLKLIFIRKDTISCEYIPFQCSRNANIKEVNKFLYKRKF